MSKPGIFVLLVLASLRLAHHASAQKSDEPNYFTEVCRSKYGNYSDNSPYELSLKSVLNMTSLQARTSTYQNSSVESGEETVYVQYYCRGDVSTPTCSNCIDVAASSIFEKCHGFRSAVIWYEECTLRYGNESMVGIEAELPAAWGWSTLNLTNPDKFLVVLNDTRDKVIQMAVDSPFLFAEEEAVVSPSQNVSMLAQCSHDLIDTPALCQTCLLSAFQNFKLSGTWCPRLQVAFYPSCQIKYSSDSPNSTLSYSDNVFTAQSPPPSRLEKRSSNYVTRAVIPAVVIGLLIILGVLFYLIKRNNVLSSKRQNLPTGTIEDGAEDSEVQNADCVQFDLKAIETATNTFSVSNKLGQGGFGIVYQGVLKDGQDIAVKRLSKNSGQGAKEFRTEVAVVAKLQHKNLVRLVGCCVDGEERLLVYEFLGNLSLDRFLYDAVRSAYLTWEVRNKIILGIARGLHYLHEDSRVKIVHRDLKISNILLDDNLEPKIADFGLAKLVEVDQTSDNTTKVVGTYGYMAPEYALAGRYSTKSDVYSFGVILLEILSGKVNSRFYETSKGEGLLGYGWRVWNEGEIDKLMDPVLQNNYSRIEAERCLQIGLLCVQDDESNRPPMHAVLVMLNSINVEIPPPFSLSHSSYINRLSSADTTQEGTRRQHQNDSTKSSITYSLNEADKEINAR